MDDTELDVIIVGAGLSGLSAVYKLNQRCPEMKILILEANDRIGGRTEAIVVDIPLKSGENDTLDMGAHWISSQQKDIMELANDFGIEYYPQNVNGTKVMQVGADYVRTYNSSIPNHGSYFNPITWICLLQNLILVNKLERMVESINILNPYLSENAEIYDSQTLDSWLRENISYDSIMDTMVAAVRTILGCEPSQISLLFFLTYAKAAGSFMDLCLAENHGAQELKVKGGTPQFCYKLAKCIQGEKPMLLSHTVSRLIQDAQSVKVIYDNGKSRDITMGIFDMKFD